MQILVLDDSRPELTTIEQALRAGEIAFLAAERGPHAPAAEPRYGFAGWTLDPAARDVVDAAGLRAKLTSSEFDLLLLFLRRPGEAISRAELVRALKGRAWDYFDRSIDTLVARLRKAVDRPHAPSLIRSVRGVGYVFCAAIALHR